MAPQSTGTARRSGVNWHDAVLNTSLIVGGIGPYIVPQTAIGKLFFAGYSMFVSLVFVATLGIILASLDPE